MTVSAGVRGPRTADAVVVGGGVNGASIAYNLALAGLRNVVVVERSHLGAGATGKSGALVRAHYSNAPETALTLYSLEVFRNWKERVGFGDAGFRAPGFLRVVAPEHEEKLRANVEMQRALGGNTWVASGAELREIEPLLRTDDISCAAFEPDSGYADPNRTLYGFIEAAQEYGATVETGVEATGLVIEGGRVLGVETTSGVIHAPIVVLATGALTDRLLTPIGVDLGLFPRRTQVAVFVWPETVDQGREHRVVIDSTQHSWIRPYGPGGTLIGVEYGKRDGMDPLAYPEMVDEGFIERARTALTARFPVFERSTMRGSWTGVFMQSPDDHPIMGAIDGYDGLYVVTGDSGSSFKTAPAIGVCMTELITSGKATTVDLHPFRPGRFAEGKPWVDETAYDRTVETTISR